MGFDGLDNHSFLFTDKQISGQTYTLKFKETCKENPDGQYNLNLSLQPVSILLPIHPVNTENIRKYSGGSIGKSWLRRTYPCIQQYRRGKRHFRCLQYICSKNNYPLQRAIDFDRSLPITELKTQLFPSTMLLCFFLRIGNRKPNQTDRMMFVVHLFQQLFGQRKYFIQNR